MDGSDDIFLEQSSLLGANRPLRLRLGPSPRIPADSLIPQTMFGHEAICGGIEYRVLCVSPHAGLPLASLIALPAALDIVTDQGQLRSVCGIVTRASAGDSDGALASYELVFQDGFAIMDKRVNTRVFRRLSDIDIVKILLDEWIRSNSVLARCPWRGPVSVQCHQPVDRPSAADLEADTVVSDSVEPRTDGNL